VAATGQASGGSGAACCRGGHGSNRDGQRMAHTVVPRREETGEGDASIGGPLRPQQLASGSHRRRWPVGCVGQPAGPSPKA
jgi:hypothetical protein